MARLAVLGSVNMDLVVRTPRFPLPGETLLGHGFRTVPGGKGANQAVAARRLGAEVSLVGRVGDDGFGQALHAGLAREGVDTAQLTVTPGESTGVALITVEDGGENTILVVPGANARVSPEDVDAACVALEGASALLLQLETPLPAVQRAVERASARGVRVLLNAAPAQPLPASLLAQVDVLVVNETEAALLAGTASSRAVPEEDARTLLGAGARSVVVTLGREGALLVGRDGRRLTVPGFPVRAVDTTAAGDAFVGAFAVALAEGRAERDALVRGCAAGALAVTREGAQPSLPMREKVEAFLALQRA
jgi:ribokinase